MNRPRQALLHVYERMRRHAIRPGSVVGIDSWMVLVEWGLARWMSVVRLSLQPPRPTPTTGSQAKVARPRIDSTLTGLSLPKKDQETLLDVFVAMLIAHETPGER